MQREPYKATDAQQNVRSASHIFARHGTFILTVIRSKVQNPTVVEDLYQDFFLMLVANPIPQDVKNIKGSCQGTIEIHITDALRRRGIYRKHLHHYPGIDARPAPDHDAELPHEEIDNLFHLIDQKLPPAHARALNLKYKKHMNLRQIAEKMDVEKKSVIKYISSGLRKVRSMAEVK